MLDRAQDVPVKVDLVTSYVPDSPLVTLLKMLAI